jgi:hypothetical protein
MKIFHKLQKIIGYYVILAFVHNCYAATKRKEEWNGYPYMNHITGQNISFKRKCPILNKIDLFFGRNHVGIWCNHEDNIKTGYWILDGEKYTPNEIKLHYYIA